MNTGKDDIGNLGKIETWQSRDRTDAFEGECGKVRRMRMIYMLNRSLTL